MGRKIYLFIFAFCVVVSNVNAQSANGHEYVDLGLPSGLLWAATNVGADSAEGYGLYFAWGETVGYGSDTDDGRSFDWASYKWINDGEDDYTQINKYTIDDGETDGCWYEDDTFIGDNKTVLEHEDDAANANWGGKWRMPTIDEMQELFDNTTSEWVNQNGVVGLKLTSNTNGNSIFLPAAGYREDSDLSSEESSGYYWSSSLDPSYSDSACLFDFSSTRREFVEDYRIFGQCIRPVIEADATSIKLLKDDMLNGKQDVSRYNLNGQRVNDSYRGVVIVNGKKQIQR